MIDSRRRIRDATLREDVAMPGPTPGRLAQEIGDSHKYPERSGQPVPEDLVNFRTFEDGIRSMRFMDAAVRSARTRAWADLDSD